jgi:hypothetical protein
VVAWTPLELGGKLISWLDAAEPSAVAYGTSGRVHQWIDRSGNGTSAVNIASTVTDQPRYKPAAWLGSQPALVFSAADYHRLFLPAVYYDSAAGLTIYAAAQCNNVGTSIVSGNNGAPQFRFTSGPNLEIVRAAQAQIQTLAISTGFHIVGTEASLNFTSLIIDGTRTTGTNDPGFSTPIVWVGESLSGGFEPFDGALSELILATGLTTAQRESLEGYLAWKWGTTSSLPAGHTYKSSAPQGSGANQSGRYLLEVPQATTLSRVIGQHRSCLCNVGGTATSTKWRLYFRNFNQSGGVNIGFSELEMRASAAASWSTADKDADITVSNKNLTAASNASGGDNMVRGTLANSSGYFEVTVDTGGTFMKVGVATYLANLSSWLGVDTNSCGYDSGGNVYYNGTVQAAVGSYTTGDKVMVAVKGGKVFFGKNGTWVHGDPAAGTGGTAVAGTLLPAVSLSISQQATANFGQTTHTYSVPTGCSPWSTGPDQCNGGTSSASSVGTGSSSANAFDNSTSTMWFNGGNEYFSWLEYDFTSSVNVNEISITARTDAADNGYGPLDFDVQYWTGGGWATLWSVITTSWTQSETRTFTLPPTALMARWDAGSNTYERAVRATQASPGKRQFEVTLDVVPSGAPNIRIGLDDGSGDLQYWIGGTPSWSFNGTMFYPYSASACQVWTDNAGATVAAGSGGGAQQGDVITVEYDTSAGTVSYYQTRSGSTTLIYTVSGVPSSYCRAFVSAYRNSTDAAIQMTVNFGATAFTRALSSGYTSYDAGLGLGAGGNDRYLLESGPPDVYLAEEYVPATLPLQRTLLPYQHLLVR